MSPKKFVEFFLRPLVLALESCYSPVRTLSPREVTDWKPDRVYYGLDWSWDLEQERLWGRLRAALRRDRGLVSWYRKREAIRLLLSVVSVREARDYAALVHRPWDAAPDGDQVLRSWAEI